MNAGQGRGQRSEVPVTCDPYYHTTGSIWNSGKPGPHTAEIRQCSSRQG